MKVSRCDFCDIFKGLCGVRTLIGLLLFVALAFQGAETVQAQTKQKPFENQFWSFLIGNNYKQWAPGPDQNGEFYTGQAPHGALLKMYINRAAASDVGDLKIGSVVVLENYLSDRSLKTISVMYRTKDFNPAGNDWYWIEYKPDGSVLEAVEEMNLADSADSAEVADSAAADPIDSFKLPSDQQDIDVTAVKTRLMGKASSCIACHQRADGNDFAFFNDGINSNTAGIEPSAEAITLR